MKLNTIADLKSAAALRENQFTTESGLEVRIRELTLAQRNEFQRLVTTDEKSTVSAWLVATSCINDSGEKVFAEADAETIKQLSPQVLEDIGLEVLRLSGLAAPGKPSAQTSASSTD